MKFFVSLICSVVICSLVNVTFSQEPTNLADAKASLVQYHNSGQYEKDINEIINQAFDYLKISLRNPPKGKKLAVILDIDETALSNYHFMSKMNFGGTPKHFKEMENLAQSPAISSTLKLYRFLKAHHVDIFFVSGRPESQRLATILNLKRVGYDYYRALILRPKTYLGQHNTVAFKTSVRKKIIEQGYIILANIGDQQSDLIGGYADKVFKLPNPFYRV